MTHRHRVTPPAGDAEPSCLLFPRAAGEPVSGRAGIPMATRAPAAPSASAGHPGAKKKQANTGPDKLWTAVGAAEGLSLD